MLRRRGGEPAGQVGAAVPLPRGHQVGSSELPVPLDRREAAGQPPPIGALPAMPDAVYHCLSPDEFHGRSDGMVGFYGEEDMSLSGGRNVHVLCLLDCDHIWCHHRHPGDGPEKGP